MTVRSAVLHAARDPLANRVGGSKIRATGANCSLSGMVLRVKLTRDKLECWRIGKFEVALPRRWRRENREAGYRKDDPRDVAC